MIALVYLVVSKQVGAQLDARYFLVVMETELICSWMCQTSYFWIFVTSIGVVLDKFFCLLLLLSRILTSRYDLLS